MLLGTGVRVLTEEHNADVLGRGQMEGAEHIRLVREHGRGVCVVVDASDEGVKSIPVVPVFAQHVGPVIRQPGGVELNSHRSSLRAPRAGRACTHSVPRAPAAKLRDAHDRRLSGRSRLLKGRARGDIRARAASCPSLLCSWSSAGQAPGHCGTGMTSESEILGNLGSQRQPSTKQPAKEGDPSRTPVNNGGEPDRRTLPTRGSRQMSADRSRPRRTYHDGAARRDSRTKHSCSGDRTRTEVAGASLG